MAVDRLLPTQEAEDLLDAHPRARRQGARAAGRGARAGRDLPGGPVRDARRGRPARPALPRGGRRRGPAVRGLPAGARGAGRALGRGGRRDERARAVVLPAVHVRHRRQQEQLAARDARRRADRRLQPLRAAGRFRRGRADAARPRGSTTGYRITGTKAWITHGGVADFYALFARTGEGSRGVSCFLAPGQAEGLSFGQARGEDGPARDPDDHGELGRRGARRRPADRRRGPGPADRVLARSTPAGSGIAAVRHRARAGRAGRGRRLRATSASTFGKKIVDHQGLGFLLADMAAAVDSARATYLDAARRRDARAAVRPPGQRGQARRHRRGHEGHHRRRPGASAATATPATSRSSATCARPRSCRSSRAPTRSSAWSSAGTSPADPPERRPVAAPPSRDGQIAGAGPADPVSEVHGYSREFRSHG